MVEAKGYRAPVVFGAQAAAPPSEIHQEDQVVFVDEDKLKARYNSCISLCCQSPFQFLRLKYLQGISIWYSSQAKC